jgi:hypothetical protein
MSDQPGFPGPSNYPPQQPIQPSPFGNPGMQPPMQPPMQPGMQPPQPFQPTFPPQQPAMGFGPQGPAAWGPSFGSSPTPPKGSGGRTGLIIAVSVAVIGLSIAGWLITRDTEDKVARTLDTLNVTVPSFNDVLATTPTIPAITIPTIPAVTVPGTVVDQTVVPTIAPETTVPAPETTLPAPPPAINLFDGTQANDVIAAIAAARAASPLRILEANLYPTYAFAQVQDPNTPVNVDEFDWRDGNVAPPAPVQLTGDGDLESNLFSDSDVNWNAIPGLVGAALAQIPIEGAQVTHVHIARNLPFSADVQIRVFVDGTRNSGYLDADAQGNIIAVNQS